MFDEEIVEFYDVWERIPPIEIPIAIVEYPLGEENGIYNAP